MNTKLILPAVFAGALAITGIAGIPSVASAAQTYKSVDYKGVNDADGKPKYKSVTTKTVTTGESSGKSDGKLKAGKSGSSSGAAYKSVEIKAVTDVATGKVIYKSTTVRTVEK